MFRLRIEMENDAFAQDPMLALRKILREVAASLPGHSEVPGTGSVGRLVFDTNGNTCGEWTLDLPIREES